MPIEDENEALNSSNNAPQDAAADSSGEEGSAADSSAALDEKDTLSIVRDVVEDKEEEGSDSSSEGEEGADFSEEDDAALVAKEPDNENYTDVPFNKHPRFQALVREKNELRPDAANFRTLKAFMAENALSDADVADALVTRALVNSDPVAAWQRLKPMVEQLLLAAGEILPPELEQRVQAGEIPRDMAVQFSRQQAQTRSLAQRQQFDQQAAQTRAQREAEASRMDAAAAWERDRLAKDPNFAAKQPEIMKEVVWLQKVEGVPQNAEGVKLMLEKAYRSVSARMRKPAQKSTPRPSAVSQGANTKPAKAATTLDVIDSVLAKRAG